MRMLWQGGSRSDKPFRNRIAVICDLCHDKVKGLPLSPVVIARDTTSKPDYRVWGRFYTGANITVTGSQNDLSTLTALSDLSKDV